MNTQLLFQISEALYGPRWQTELSREISVSDRTVRRWAAGTDEVAPGAWRDLYRRLENRVTELADMKYRLSGLLGIREMTLQPIPNGAAEWQPEGVYFAMERPDGKDIRCFVRREIFSDRIGVYTAKNVLPYFKERSQSFHLAASTKFDMREFNDKDGIIIGNEDVIPTLNVL
jgi:hypothetical protein